MTADARFDQIPYAERKTVAMTKLPPAASYQLEVRTPARKPRQIELISRGETQESARDAFDHYVRSDAFGGPQMFGPHSGHRLIVTQTGRMWIPGPLHPDNVADPFAARYFAAVEPRPKVDPVDEHFADVVALAPDRYQVWLNTGNMMGRLRQGGPSDLVAARDRRQRLRAALPFGSSDWYTVEVAR